MKCLILNYRKGSFVFNMREGLTRSNAYSHGFQIRFFYEGTYILRFLARFRCKVNAVVASHVSHNENAHLSFEEQFHGLFKFGNVLKLLRKIDKSLSSNIYGRKRILCLRNKRFLKKKFISL